MAERRSRAVRIDPSRLAALEVLKAVRVDDAYANLALPKVLAEHGLSGRDAAFTTELVSGTIRLQGTYDAIIDACLTKPRLEAKVRDVLRLGTHQLLSMRVPDHAAISSSVELARARIGVGPVGLVNAVLRKVAAHDLDGWIRRVAPDPGTDPFGYASIAHSHPRWVVEELADSLASAVQLEDLLAADNAPPRVMLVARPGLATVAELVAAGGTASTSSPYAVELPGGDPSAIPAVAEGRAGVQDEGSQLVALALAAAELEGRDERWLDVCAGPGGKSALLAALAVQRGALLLANESQHHRARLVVRGCRAAAAGLVGVVTGDGTRPPWRDGTFDRVLVDAPCSGLGALRRRPESRWRRSPADLDVLVPLQRALLDHALDAVRPGGVVVYATCSPVLAETTEVVDAVVGARDDASVVATRQLWPHRDGTDAMFISTVRRR
ncbi:RsmB/NOP family class I SAM-dependent RNA methyltransferase [Nocardioides sp. P5_C9_2]